MINQQLLDYIKQQLQQGVNNEQIKQSLITNGWQSADIEEAFNSINYPTQSQPVSSLTNKTPMKIWKIILVSIVGILLVGSGIYFISQKFFKPAEKPVEKFQLDLDITTPKDTYKIGEKLTDGKYLLNYNGNPFKAIVLYTKLRKGFEDKSAYSKAAGIIKTGDFDSSPGLREVLQPFKMDKTGFEVGKDSFQEAGEYIFIMSVYRCSDIGLKDEDCTARTPTEFILNFQPLDSVTKIITVIDEGVQKEGTAPPEQEKEITGETVLDCIGVEDPQCTLKFFNLFKENLQLCKPSRGTTPIGWEPAMGLFRGYEILGIQNNLCVINFWFLKTKDVPATLLDKQMTCKYGASERTIEKVAKGENCTGPLLEEFDKLLGQ